MPPLRSRIWDCDTAHRGLKQRQSLADVLRLGKSHKRDPLYTRGVKARLTQENRGPEAHTSRPEEGTCGSYMCVYHEGKL